MVCFDLVCGHRIVRTGIANVSGAFFGGLLLIVLSLLMGDLSWSDEVRLIGRTQISATATDLSGESDAQENGTPQNRLGGHGSGIAWLGSGNRYVMLPDRGPDDGATSYRCRFHIVEIKVDPNAQPPVTTQLLETHLLTNPRGENFVGRATQFDAGQPDRSLRLDPEGIRATSRGTFFISEEYRPSVFEFDSKGHWLRELPAPERYLIEKPGGVPQEELPPHNQSGRQTNRGWEGVALSLDEQKVYAMVQSPLIQDGGLDAANQRVGTNARIWEYHLTTGTSREFLYPLEDKSLGCSDIVAVGPNQLLVIERDGLPGDSASFKRLYEVDFSHATDIQNIAQLPTTGIPGGVRPVAKKLFLDLLDPKHGLAGSQFPEKIEGIALGPKLPDGSRVLIVASDNDFKSDQPTEIFAFRVK
jgi:hypothetical protein